MRNTIGPLFLILLFLVAAPAWAQEARVLDEGALHDAVVGRAATEEADRAAITRLLQRDDVRRLAAGAGLDVAQAEANVAGLRGQQLADLAAQSRKAEAQLIGGQDRIVITTTGLILILLVVIILLLL